MTHKNMTHKSMTHRYLKNVTTLKFAADSCAGCGRCLEVCPHGVFEMEEGKARAADMDLCMECGACALNCPAGAIEVNAGVGCAAAIIMSWFTGKEPTCGSAEDPTCGCGGGDENGGGSSSGSRSCCG